MVVGSVEVMVPGRTYMSCVVESEIHGMKVKLVDQYGQSADDDVMEMKVGLSMVFYVYGNVMVG